MTGRARALDGDALRRSFPGMNTRKRAPAATAPSLKFSMINIVLLVLGLASIIGGYVLLAGGSIVGAPLLLVLGYAVLVPLAIIL